MERKRVLILGAAGRDFHNFNVFFRDKKEYEVVGFTSAQIPGIENRVYPKELAGKFYKKGIKIYPENELEKIIEAKKVDIVVFSYSDVSDEYIMELASRALSKGCDFWLLGPNSTMIKSKKPVIAITAVRTGCGKSSIAAKVAKILKLSGKKVCIIRHPMPYGNIKKQIFQEFKSEKDLKNESIEEREEIEFHLRHGNDVYTGVDMKTVLENIERKYDIIIWDGGNNDFPFIRPDIWITVVDALRQEVPSYLGKVCLKYADIIVINKVNMVKSTKKIEEYIKKINPKAKIIKTASILKVEGEIGKIKKNKKEKVKAIVIEDGPTTTHGGMKYGPGLIVAKKLGFRIINAEKYATGVFKDIYSTYKLKKVIPAIGYNKKQIKDLEKMITKIVKNEKANLIVCASQADIEKIIKLKDLKVKIIKVRFEINEVSGSLKEIVNLLR